MVFWCNTPNRNNVVPSRSLYSYNVKLPKVSPLTIGKPTDITTNPYNVGDKVYVKPVNSKCTTAGPQGTITRVVSNTAVMVDGMTRHISDVRLANTGKVVTFCLVHNSNLRYMETLQLS